MMKRHDHSALASKQRGFSLLEVLIAVVVLAAGLLALTALQGALVRSSADAKARSQLAAFAHSVMEKAQQSGYGNIPVGASVSIAEQPDIDPGGLARTAAAMGASNVTETSSVTETVNGDSRYKTINLRFNWTDATGTSRSISMAGVVSPLVLTKNDLVNYDNSTNIYYRPIVRRPTPVTEGMIPIAVGNGEDTAATNPKPQLVGRDNNTLVSDTRFDLLTFNASDNLGQAGYVRFDKRIETAMVGCTCQTGTNGFPTGGSSPEINSLLKVYAFRPSYWDGTRYTEPEIANYSPARSPDTSVAQSQLCDVCCRDHEDDRATAGEPRFNPWSTTHDHYLDPTGSTVTSGTFREACRVVRVNGVWRVTPDPKVQDVALLPTRVYPATTGSTAAPADNNTATSPLVSDAGKTSYVAFAYDFIKQFFYDKTALTSTNLRDMQGGAGLNNPEYVPIKAGDKRWLHARAILTDFLEPDAITRRDKAISDCTGTTTVTQAQCVLPVVPMATINATEVAAWSGKENSETGIVLSGSLATASVIKNYAQALLRRFVSGLALIGPINPADSADPVKDEQTFALASSEDRTGTWLTVASPAGVLFGNPFDPSRGFATLSGGTQFYIALAGLPYARDRDPGNDPSVNIGTTVPQPCNPVDAAQGGSPFRCSSGSTSNVSVAIGRFNYLETSNGNIDDPCDGVGKIGQGQAVCRAYSLTGGTLVSGNLAKPSEVSSYTLASVTAGATYTLNFTAVNPVVNATAVCSTTNNWVGWKCE